MLKVAVFALLSIPFIARISRVSVLTTIKRGYICRGKLHIFLSLTGLILANPVASFHCAL